MAKGSEGVFPGRELEGFLGKIGEPQGRLPESPPPPFNNPIRIQQKMGHGKFLFCFETDIFVDEVVGVFLGLQLVPAVKSLEQETSWIYSFQWMEMVHFHVISPCSSRPVIFRAAKKSMESGGFFAKKETLANPRLMVSQKESPFPSA